MQIVAISFGLRKGLWAIYVVGGAFLSLDFVDVVCSDLCSTVHGAFLSSDVAEVICKRVVTFVTLRLRWCLHKLGSKVISNSPN